MLSQTNIITRTPGSSIQTLNGTQSDLRASIRWTWRTAFEILIMFSKSFWTTALKSTRICRKGPRGRKFIFIKAVGTRDSLQFTRETSSTRQILEMWGLKKWLLRQSSM